MTDGSISAGYQLVDPHAAVSANRRWWDENASSYLAEHGEFLGERELTWCPEGLRESQAHLLGTALRGKRVLEVGAGAAQGSRWLRTQGALPIALDISGGMLMHAAGVVPAIQADAAAIPLAPRCIDIAFSAYGALPFAPNIEAIHREVARVLRPGGRWVFSVSHPIRWVFPDTPDGLSVIKSYFDRTPYVETSGDPAPVTDRGPADRGPAGRREPPTNTVLYAEYHRTMSDHVRALRAAGFIIEDLIEPEWPPTLEQTWGGWSPQRGQLLPGTIIWVSHI